MLFKRCSGTARYGDLVQHGSGRDSCLRQDGSGTDFPARSNSTKGGQRESCHCGRNRGCSHRDGERHRSARRDEQEHQERHHPARRHQLEGEERPEGPARSPRSGRPERHCRAAGSAGPRRGRRCQGRQGRQRRQGTGDKGDKGDLGPAVGTFGPVHLTGQDDNGCADADGQVVWAHTDEDRFFTVEPAQDGTGYFVTRYDVNGTYTTIPGREHPGCDDEGTFSSADTGTWNGVWTRKVTSEMPGFDYNPDAEMPSSGTWADFLTAFFGLAPSADPPTTSYEFDYYSSCGGSLARLLLQRTHSSARARSETARAEVTTLPDAHGSLRVGVRRRLLSQSVHSDGRNRLRHPSWHQVHREVGEAS